MIVSVLRKEAREKLKGKWKKAFLMMLVFFVTTLLLETLKLWISLNTQYGMMVNIIGIVITVVLNYGIVVAFVKLKRDEKVNCLHFIYFAGRDAEKVWKLIGRLILKLLIPIILFVLFLYLSIVEIVSLFSGYGMRLSFFIEIISAVGLAIFLCMKVLYYALMNYILYDNREYKAKEVLKESERLMKGHRWDFAKMNLSFAGWFILAIVLSIGTILLLYYFAKINSYYLLYISYIPLTFLLPYMYVTNACFYDNLVYNNPKPKDEEINNKKKKAKKKSNKSK